MELPESTTGTRYSGSETMLEKSVRLNHQFLNDIDSMMQDVIMLKDGFEETASTRFGKWRFGDEVELKNFEMFVEWFSQIASTIHFHCGNTLQRNESTYKGALPLALVPATR